jgi:membrane dipeptidase
MNLRMSFQSMCRVTAWGAAVQIMIAIPMPIKASSNNDKASNRVQRILTESPVFDGHNDMPDWLRAKVGGDLSKIDLNSDTSKIPPSAGYAAMMTDIPRLRKGGVGAQFWSVWIDSALAGPLAVQTTLEQIDLVSQMTAQYPETFELATTAADVRRIEKKRKIASLIGVEGGHQINNQISVLRQMYDLGARYMTLTHSSNNDWADSATDIPKHNGLTPFGKEVVREMNRLGMIVDISHVSNATMRDALDTTEAPVIFSHSSARALDDHPRNVPDDILTRMKQNGGVVMVTFEPAYVSTEFNHWLASRSAEQARLSSPPYIGIYIGQPERIAAGMAAWDKEHPKPVVTLLQVADHFDHIRKVAGIDHIGIGSDFDGITDAPEQLDSVDDYPNLLAELIRRGWSDSDVKKVTGGNILRVMEVVETVSHKLRKSRPASTARIEPSSPKTP